VNSKTVRVFVDVPEAAAAMAKVGQDVRVKVGPKEIAAKITRTSGVLSPDTRTLKVEIDLANEDGSVRPGSYATVQLTSTVPDAFTLPTACVLFADETAYVYEIVAGKAAKKRVQTGRNDGSTIHILGMKANPAAAWQPLTGQEQFAQGQLGALADGQAVAVK
jgi:hypothetical protein